MKAYSFAESQRRYFEILEEVIEDREPAVITRGGRRSVVLISLDYFNSLAETEYLLRSPANAAHLQRAIQRYREGHIERHDLTED